MAVAFRFMVLLFMGASHQVFQFVGRIAEIFGFQQLPNLRHLRRERGVAAQGLGDMVEMSIVPSALPTRADERARLACIFDGVRSLTWVPANIFSMICVPSWRLLASISDFASFYRVVIGALQSGLPLFNSHLCVR